MADYGAFAGAMMLSQQLSNDRFMDDLERVRDGNRLSADYGVLRQRFSELVAQYNVLTRNHDELRRQAEKVSRGSDRKADTIAQLETKVRSLEATAATRAWETEKDKADIAFLEVALASVRRRYNDLVPGSFSFE